MVSDTGTQAGRPAPPYERTLFTCRREPEIAALLEELAARAPGIAISSRPGADGVRARLEIVLAARDERRLDAAASWLAERLPGQPAA